MPDVSEGWGRLTWGQAGWNEATLLYQDGDVLNGILKLGVIHLP